MDVVTIAKFIILPIALGSVALVLVLGLANMARGGSPLLSQKLMQWRVLLQAVALCFVLATIILMNHS
ncbi:twin transmembrane helix small protein [Ancylobacter sp. TS-1]|uniref:twin transmembrane helix small protein n=1 Tax=Ancylobacter sp. TS-1 TaxID=1850374 RepID=UPI001265C6DC|nr:twin transmembrane helix small protein [Ancylobacter sp. TS-1]QFR33666.1 twin transmembrane helix small protein [Ancylobacter sp. TS-1]